IAAKRSSTGSPLQIAVDGGYSFGDEERGVGSDEQWRCAHVFDSGAAWWFALAFDDNAWTPARPSSTEMRGGARTPPLAIQATPRGVWLTPQPLTAGTAAVCRA